MIYNDYLLEQLNIVKAELGFDDFNIVVTPERIINVPENSDTLVFIVKELTATYVLGIKSQPIQIIVYSELNTFTVAKQILDLFALRHQNESWYETEDNKQVLYKQSYDSAVVLRPLIPADIGFKASLYCYGSYLKCTELSDIKELYIKNSSNVWVEVPFITASLSYSSVLNTSKKAGVELSKSLKQEATLVLVITLMNKEDYLCKSINSIMIGEKSGNTDFELSFKWSWESEQASYHNLIMKLSSATFNTNKTEAPGMQVTFQL